MTHQCTDHVEEETSTVWRAGKDALIPAEGALFPGRCVICNRPAGWYRQLTHVEDRHALRWALVAGAAIFLTPVGAGVFWMILKYFTRAWTLPLPLCLKHRRRAGVGTAIRIVGWVLVTAGFVCIYPCAFSAFFVLLGLGLAMVVGGSHHAHFARVIGSQGDWLYLRVGRRFVESLPPVPGADAAYRNPAGPARQSVALQS